MGRGESLVTFATKPVDFRCIIIHVINIGCSHFSSTIPGSNSGCLQFCSSYLQLCWVTWSTLCTCKLGAQCKVWWARLSHKPTTVSFNFGLFGLRSLLHIQKLFSTNCQGVVFAYKFIFELTIFCWVDKMPSVQTVHKVLFCKLIGTTTARHWKLTNFPADVTRTSPPIFEESLGTRLRYKHQHCKPIYIYNNNICVR